jgi:hypothetical protein
MIVASASSDGLSGCALGIGKKVPPALVVVIKVGDFFLGLALMALRGVTLARGLAGLRRNRLFSVIGVLTPLNLMLNCPNRYSELNSRGFLQ